MNKDLDIKKPRYSEQILPAVPWLFVISVEVPLYCNFSRAEENRLLYRGLRYRGSLNRGSTA